MFKESGGSCKDPFKFEFKEGEGCLKTFKVYGVSQAPYLSGISLMIDGQEKKFSLRNDPCKAEVALVDDIHTIRINSSSFVREIKFIGKKGESTTTLFGKEDVWKEYKLDEDEVIIGIYGSYNA